MMATTKMSMRSCMRLKRERQTLLFVITTCSSLVMQPFTVQKPLVALYKAGIPSILVTQHQDTDDLRLKRWRPWLPAILDKNDIDQEKVSLAFEKCIAEVKNAEPTEDRRAHRVLIDIDAVMDNEIVAFVDAWNPHVSVNFPRKLVAHLGQISEGTFLLAEVNIGASHRRDLFFTNFQLAPMPDPNDGLA